MKKVSLTPQVRFFLALLMILILAALFLFYPVAVKQQFWTPESAVKSTIRSRLYHTPQIACSTTFYGADIVRPEKQTEFWGFTGTVQDRFFYAEVKSAGIHRYWVSSFLYGKCRKQEPINYLWTQSIDTFKVAGIVNRSNIEKVEISVTEYPEEGEETTKEYQFPVHNGAFVWTQQGSDSAFGVNWIRGLDQDGNLVAELEEPMYDTQHEYLIK